MTNTEEQKNAAYFDEEEDLELDEFEVVATEFFPDNGIPCFTVNVDKLTANAVSVRLFPDVDYVKYMIKREKNLFLLKPCSEDDVYAFKWVREKNGRRYGKERKSEYFVEMLCEAMGWNPNFRYKIRGRKRRASNGDYVLAFNLTDVRCFEKATNGKDGKQTKSVPIPSNWNGRFGPTYAESKHTLELSTFDGCTVISLDGKKGISNADGSGVVEETDRNETNTKETTNIYEHENAAE